jgi:hypothetical protein
MPCGTRYQHSSVGLVGEVIMFKFLKTDPFLIIPMVVGGIFLTACMMVFLALINEALGTQTVLSTFPGTKQVCARQQYNYSLKVTQCAEYRTVPATCKNIERSGPIFDTFTNVTCD